MTRKTATEVILANVTTTIRKARKAGTVEMSYANLKQITPTTGLDCHPCEYHRLFPELATLVAKKLRFNLHHC